MTNTSQLVKEIQQKILKIEIDVFIIKTQLDEITSLLNQIQDVQRTMAITETVSKRQSKKSIT